MTPVVFSSSVRPPGFLVPLFLCLHEAARGRSARVGKGLLESGQCVSDKGMKGVR